MIEYQIRASGIAACISVRTAALGEYSCIYIKAGVIEAYLNHNLRLNVWRALPEPVREAVTRDFAEVFALPIEERGAAVDASKPYTVEVSDGTVPHQ